MSVNQSLHHFLEFLWTELTAEEPRMGVGVIEELRNVKRRFKQINRLRFQQRT